LEGHWGLPHAVESLNLPQPPAAEVILDTTTNPEEGSGEREEVSPIARRPISFFLYPKDAWFLPSPETLGNRAASFSPGGPAPLTLPDEYVI
jgi:hypothetical protein